MTSDNEFSESDMSDVEGLEEDLSSDDEVGDIHEDWSKIPSDEIPGDFNFERPESANVNFSPLEAFLSLISHEIISRYYIIESCTIIRIVQHTNTGIRRLSYKMKRSSSEYSKYKAYLQETDETEIKALFGVWLSLGANGFHSVPVSEIFSSSRSSSSLGNHFLNL